MGRRPRPATQHKRVAAQIMQDITDQAPPVLQGPMHRREQDDIILDSEGLPSAQNVRRPRVYCPVCLDGDAGMFVSHSAAIYIACSRCGCRSFYSIKAAVYLAKRWQVVLRDDIMRTAMLGMLEEARSQDEIETGGDDE